MIKTSVSVSSLITCLCSQTLSLMYTKSLCLLLCCVQLCWTYEGDQTVSWEDQLTNIVDRMDRLEADLEAKEEIISRLREDMTVKDERTAWPGPAQERDDLPGAEVVQLRVGGSQTFLRLLQRISHCVGKSFL